MSHAAGVPAGQSATVRLSVLACPAALCPHLEFALSALVEAPVSLRWAEQPGRAGALMSVVELRGAPGLAGRIAGRLRALGPVHFEVLEDASAPPAVADAERYSYTPDLGLFRTGLAANGDVVVTEGRLRELLAASHRRADGAATLAHGLERLLGTAWDEELEPLRRGGDGAPVCWLRRTG
ncbi:MAG TPA: DUF3145 family protein [Mycobacteriales bacterium]